MIKIIIYIKLKEGEGVQIQEYNDALIKRPKEKGRRGVG